MRSTIHKVWLDGLYISTNSFITGKFLIEGPCKGNTVYVIPSFLYKMRTCFLSQELFTWVSKPIRRPFSYSFLYNYVLFNWLLKIQSSQLSFFVFFNNHTLLSLNVCSRSFSFYSLYLHIPAIMILTIDFIPFMIQVITSQDSFHETRRKLNCSFILSCPSLCIMV